MDIIIPALLFLFITASYALAPASLRARAVMKKTLKILGLVIMLIPAHVHSQVIEGTDFWLIMPPNTNVAPPSIVLQSNYYTKVTLTYPSFPSGISQTTYLVPGTQSVLVAKGDGTFGSGFPREDFTVEDFGVHVTSDCPVTVYIVPYFNFSVDAETILPTSMLGTHYVVGSRSSTETKFTVVATENNTNVMIRTWYRPDIGNDKNSGNDSIQRDTVINVVLNAGQIYTVGLWEFYMNKNGNLVMAKANVLTGSEVFSDKPVAVFGHTGITYMVECGTGDMTITELLPVKLWGKRYVTAQSLQRSAPTNCLNETSTSGDYIEIIGRAGQQVTIRSSNGIQTKTIPPLPFASAVTPYSFLWYDNPAVAGPTSTEPFGEANLIITSAEPFAVIQYEKGTAVDRSANADPEACVVYPEYMWKSDYLMSTFVPLGSANIGQAVIVVKDTAGAKDIMLNNTSISGLTTWQDFAGGYSFARITLPALTVTHRLRNTNGVKFGFYITFMSYAESYTVQGGGYGAISGNCASSVPVTFLDLTATTCAEGVRLNWKTASEQDCEHFEIERAHGNDQFIFLGAVKCSGNTSSLREYTYTDPGPLPGKSYYRLRESGAGGEKSSGNIVSVHLPIAAITGISPNPVTAGSSVSVSYRSTGEKAEVTIYNMLGEAITKAVSEGSGDNSITINTGTLPQGQYILELKTEDGGERRKLTVQ